MRIDQAAPAAYATLFVLGHRAERLLGRRTARHHCPAAQVGDAQHAVAQRACRSPRRACARAGSPAQAEPGGGRRQPAARSRSARRRAGRAGSQTQSSRRFQYSRSGAARALRLPQRRQRFREQLRSRYGSSTTRPAASRTGVRSRTSAIARSARPSRSRAPRRGTGTSLGRRQPLAVEVGQPPSSSRLASIGCTPRISVSSTYRRPTAGLWCCTATPPASRPKRVNRDAAEIGRRGAGEVVRSADAAAASSPTAPSVST